MNRSDARAGKGFLVGALVAIVSGSAALAHQLLWTRRLIDILGASHESSARVLGCFFTGLALGSALAAYLAPRLTRTWRWVGAAELGVALLSLPALTLELWTGWLWPTLGLAALDGWLGSLVKTLVSGGVVLPPATAMGATLPWLVLAVVRSGGRTARHGVWLYAINTLGGVVGLTVTTLLLLPDLGGLPSMAVAAAANVVLAGVCFVADRWFVPGAVGGERLEPTEGPEEAGRPLLPALGVAFVSGLAVLGFEVAALQELMLVAPLSFYAPAGVLSVVIAMLAIGAALSPSLASLVPPVRALPWVLVAAGLTTAATPVLFFGAAKTIGLQPMATFWAWFVRLQLLTLASLGPAMLAAAFVFPLSVSWAGAGHARRLGWLLAANGLGGLLGAELTYRLLLPAFGPHLGVGAIGVVYLAAAAVFFIVRARGWLDALVPAGLPLLAAAIVVARVERLPLVNPYLGFTVVEHRSGREGTVAVVERDDYGRALLMSNQYTLGGTGARWDQERQALIPLVLHPEPREVAFLGVATGITPGAALADPAVEQVTAIELSPLVLDLASQHFASFNRGVVGDDRVEIIQDDARTAIAAAPGRFDVVVGDLFLPWGAGEARLYSVEHFQAVRQSLRPGGLFCQWLAMYQLTPDQFEVIARSFQEVFGQAQLVLAGFGLEHPKLGLIGFRDGEGDRSTIYLRTHQLQAAGVTDPVVRHAEGIRLLDLGAYAPPPGPLNTLGNLEVEVDAGRQRITGTPDEKYMTGSRFAEFVERVSPGAAAQPLLAWEQRREGQPTPRSVRASVPSEVRNDRDADWERWPGRPGWR